MEIIWDKERECYITTADGGVVGEQTVENRGLDHYSTCKEVLQHETILKNIQPRNVLYEHCTRLYRYKRVLDIYYQFKDKSAFVELFGDKSPKSVYVLFGENQRTHLEAYARKRGIEINWNADAECYRITRIIE